MRSGRRTDCAANPTFGVGGMDHSTTRATTARGPSLSHCMAQGCSELRYHRAISWVTVRGEGAGGSRFIHDRAILSRSSPGCGSTQRTFVAVATLVHAGTQRAAICAVSRRGIQLGCRELHLHHGIRTAQRAIPAICSVWDNFVRFLNPNRPGTASHSKEIQLL